MVELRPRNGAVIRYAFLWKREQEQGLEEGKERPAAVVLAHEDTVTGQTIVFVLPITRQSPTDPSAAVEIPADVKASLRLGREPSWIICDEVNRFVWPGPDLRLIPGPSPLAWEYGMLPRGLYRRVKTVFLECRRDRRLRTSRRSE